MDRRSDQSDDVTRLGRRRPTSSDLAASTSMVPERGHRPCSESQGGRFRRISSSYAQSQLADPSARKTWTVWISRVDDPDELDPGPEILLNLFFEFLDQIVGRNHLDGQIGCDRA